MDFHHVVFLPVRKGDHMAKLSKFAKILQIVTILSSLSLETIETILALIRKDKSPTEAQRASLKC
jgi:hypothetical protein